MELEEQTKVRPKYPGVIDLTNFTHDFFSYSRRINRRIASYVTASVTQLPAKTQPLGIRSRDRAKYNYIALA